MLTVTKAERKRRKELNETHSINMSAAFSYVYIAHVKNRVYTFSVNTAYPVMS